MAEQLGRIAGTIEGTAESWMNRQKLTEQLTRVRDGAAEMLESLGAGAPKALAERGKPVKRVSRGGPRPADPAHAPGKRHRKPVAVEAGRQEIDQRDSEDAHGARRPSASKGLRLSGALQRLAKHLASERLVT